MKERTPPLTETELIKRLRTKYNEQAGNGYAWAFMPKVRNAAGFSANRTIDAYAMGLWPSRGLPLIAFEIKSSRSDWQRELKRPDKAETFCELADYFYLVVGDKDIVRHGELPETWGLMIPHGAGLRIEKEAPRLRDASGPHGNGHLPPSFDRSFVAALLRSACAVGNATPEEITKAREAAEDQARERYERETTHLTERWEKLRKDVDEFNQASGIRIEGYRWPAENGPREVGEAVKAVLHGEHQIENLEGRFRRVREQAAAIAEGAEQLDGGAYAG